MEEFKNKKYYIIVKGHPRIGITPGIKNIADEILPDYIPAELIDLNNFDAIVSILSNSLATIVDENNNVISIIDMFNFNNNQELLKYKRFLKENSNNKIRFIKDTNEIK